MTDDKDPADVLADIEREHFGDHDLKTGVYAIKSMRPAAWARPSIYEECETVLTAHKDEAAQWVDRGHTVTPLYAMPKSGDVADFVMAREWSYRAGVLEAERDALRAELAALKAQAVQPFAYVHKRGQDDEEFIHAAAVNGPCPDCEPLFLAAPQAAQPASALPPAYMLAKLQMVIPLFQEARDALTALTEQQRKLRGISPTLADRMDEAGTFSVDDWRAAGGKEGGAA